MGGWSNLSLGRWAAAGFECIISLRALADSTSCRFGVGDGVYSNKAGNAGKERSGVWGAGWSCFLFHSLYILRRTTRVSNAFDDGRTWKDE